ncbi:GNAT family N-acetyltransferase [Sphingomonas oleivorans]|uniref:GNAT family N-acetyltransferase n=1 Tax=Sphingomonas oleivorans TaxID=1735121 RepID=A0A2T5FZQ8_9SPHN|nr:GNAT family N-acetyltransferase [Sphingomonas oleivorans]PTQ12137.1 GNAT family N-acetyltransferase [Sphingomonas oleivorans]
MTGNQAGVKYIIEPLDPSKHDRAAFSCGIEQVDNYFKKTANKLAQAGNVRVHVMTDPDGALIGFYAINAHAIHYSDLPGKFGRDRPGHGHIPAAYISMIGVDSRYQGRGFGGDLLADCLRRLAGAAEAVGMRVILLDILDCGDAKRVERRRKLYADYGFTAFQSNALRMYLPMADVEALIAEGG